MAFKAVLKCESGCEADAVDSRARTIFRIRKGGCFLLSKEALGLVQDCIQMDPLISLNICTTILYTNFINNK